MKIIEIISKKFGRFEVLVDDWNYEWLIQRKWHVLKNRYDFYAVHTSSRKLGRQQMILMHRLIMKTPKGMDCDHIFHNTLDNRECNLRNCTRSQNQMNRKRGFGASCYLGVSTRQRCKKNYWVAGIGKDKKRIHLGYFPYTPEGEKQAAKTYNEAATKYFGEFASLNIIQ